MTAARPALIVIGGPPGAGKSSIACRLSRDLSIPCLCSDTTGGAIRRTLADTSSSADAFRAGYEVLFTLTREFLAHDCSVLVDTTMGWEFQWQRLDAIRQELPHARYLPVILRCPRQTCAERVNRRHEQSAGNRAAYAQISKRQHVWEYLETLDRPDIHAVDASQDADHVYGMVHRYVSEQLA